TRGPTAFRPLPSPCPTRAIRNSLWFDSLRFVRIIPVFGELIRGSPSSNQRGRPNAGPAPTFPFVQRTVYVHRSPIASRRRAASLEQSRESERRFRQRLLEGAEGRADA